MTSQRHKEDELLNADRRAFLRKSIYAAYATPLITALLVEEANAAVSCGKCVPNGCHGRACQEACGCQPMG